MSVRNSKANAKLKFLNARLDEVQMSQVERIKAKAQLAWAEAAVDIVFAIGQGTSRLLKMLVLRPIRRVTASFG
jgi:3'-phosphoadenosine 5'-phosphosulfate sulfotransferase